MVREEVEMTLEEGKLLRSWYRKRKYNLSVFIVMKCLYAFEGSAISISALYYFQNVLKVRDPKLYYSLATGALALSSMFSSAMVGRHVDRHRNLRQTSFVVGLFNIAGNLLYVLPFMNWLPIFGRFLCGIADGVRPAYVGEISRTYTSDELAPLAIRLDIYGIIAHALAPASPVLFGGVNFKLFGLSFNQYNFVAVVLIFATSLYLIMASFLLCDLTKEEGYEIFIKTTNMKSVNNSTGTDRMLSSWEMLTNPDIVLVLVTILIIDFIYTQGDLVVNMIAVNVFHWSIERLSVFPVITVFIAVAIMKGIQRLNTGVDIYFLIIVSAIGNSISMNILTILANCDIKSFILRSILLLITLNLNLVVGYGITAFTTVLLSMVVPAHSMCSVIGLRMVAIKIALCLGYFTASTLFGVSKVFYPLISVLCLALALTYLARRSVFLHKYCYQ
ncbi:uncharacterized protein [Clytia hemisphaerica]|uniref:uncharacterized protein n=1 Tax=Clytia hemisphaerica TaxID=252671 RepID=UPI0034D71951